METTDIVINLMSLEKSDVKYELITFSDGEPHITLIGDLDRKQEYKVICRITNPNELFVLMQLGDILDRQGVVWHLLITYLMSARMDRVMSFNEAFSLRIVASMLNSLHPKTIGVIEPHSSRSLTEINNSFQEHPLTNMYEGMKDGVDIVCYTDHGAASKSWHLGLNRKPIMVLNKKRDIANKGAIVSMDIEQYPTEWGSDGKILVVDDLCDGGRTFIGAAKLIREKFPNHILAIYVTHMVNPIGIKNLSENYDEVYFTDSYKDWSEEVKKYSNVTLLHLGL